MKAAITNLLSTIGEDPSREGLQETPRRFEEFLKEACTKPTFQMTTFANEGYDQMIIQQHIRFYSICEHHLVPFFGVGSIAYLPDRRIIGLSKLARTLEYCSKGLQNQERITTQVARMIEKALQPKGMAVQLVARHLCMEMRGVQKPGAVTTTTHLTGKFRNDPRTRTEFMESLVSSLP